MTVTISPVRQSRVTTCGQRSLDGHREAWSLEAFCEAAELKRLAERLAEKLL